MTDKARLLHILDAIDYIHQFLDNKNKDNFFNEPLLRFAIERQLEIIGEAANHLSDSLKNEYDDAEWRKIVAFRNFLIHEYFGVDVELVWGITQKNLAPLKTIVSQILDEI